MGVILAVVGELDVAALGVDLVDGDLGAPVGGGAVDGCGAGQRTDVAELDRAVAAVDLVGGAGSGRRGAGAGGAAATAAAAGEGQASGRDAGGAEEAPTSHVSECHKNSPFKRLP